MAFFSFLPFPNTWHISSLGAPLRLLNHEISRPGTRLEFPKAIKTPFPPFPSRRGLQHLLRPVNFPAPTKFPSVLTCSPTLLLFFIAGPSPSPSSVPPARLYSNWVDSRETTCPFSSPACPLSTLRPNIRITDKPPSSGELSFRAVLAYF